MPHKPEVRHFLSSTQSAGFHQYVFGPTHKHDHTLDLLLSRPKDNMVTDVTVGPSLISNHHFITCTLNFNKPRDVNTVCALRNFRDINTEAMNTDLTAHLKGSDLSESTN